MKGKSESEVAQSCPTLSDPMDCNLLGSSIHGIFQARVLEWGAMLQPNKFNKNKFYSQIRLFFFFFLKKEKKLSAILLVPLAGDS